MPHKIGFGVVSSSGHEDNFCAKELMVHAPTVNGWRSSRLCPYPQEITLQLTERCRIRKLQLLAHQYMISAKIEFHVGDRPPAVPSPHAPERYRRLGYVSLSDNEKTGFKARELKSVHVDAVGTYLSLTFHKNHVNRYNLYNQVALVAINILGDPVDGKEMDTIPTRDQLIEHYLNGTHQEMALDGTYTGKCDPISLLDDLAFDMYQDPEVAQIIRRLDERKQGAVRQEKYELAKTLKQAIADLQKVGERLGRYEVEKRCAIEKEDYDTARHKKEQMEEYRLNVYQQLEVHNLLDVGPIQQATEPAAKERSVPASSPSPPRSPSPAPAPSPSLEKRVQSPPEIAREKKTEKFKEQERDHTPAPASPQRGQMPPALPPAPPEIPEVDVSTLPYDDRPLPALRTQQNQQNQAEQPELRPEEEAPDPAQSPRSPRVTGEAEPLTEKAMREASFPIEVYGDGLVAAAYSKTWSYREDALLAVCKKLGQAPAGTPKEDLRTMMRAAVFLARKAILDKVSSVFQASLKLLKMILTQFIPQHKLGRAEVAHCVEQTWPNLMAKTGDPAGRLRVTAAGFIQEMALFKEVRSLQTIPAELVKPMKSSVPARLALSHVELTERLLSELGLEGSGFSLKNVMQFSAGALEHSAAEVREKAVHIVLAMYRQHRSAVLDFLPPNDAKTRRNILYKNIFDEFAKIEGRPAGPQAKTLKRNVTRVVHKQKKEEIRTLQEQLAALKEISEKEKGKENSKTKQTSRAVKAGIKKTPATKAAVVRDVDQSQVANYLDRLCIFCGEKDEAFTEEGLDLHYWKHCPMLRRCDLCRQVVEISSLNEHLLEECESKAAFTQCPHCAEAVPKDQLAEHSQSQTCNPPATDKVSNHCPLCHDNFMPGEEAWKAHLMGREGCKQNARRTAAILRALQSQGKMGSTATTKQGPVGARGRPGPSGSRIPAPKPAGSRTNRPNPVRR
ncbi:centrosomal protein of 104 kDa [Conger conger]|uniref:centrosomal protein of 104 kDa n=1 Tax=Conger conger TaxID=82655 RepID=UPI002A5A122C|nr:centrosomal protein of 104 kDa [Conger conger]